MHPPAENGRGAPPRDHGSGEHRIFVDAVDRILPSDRPTAGPPAWPPARDNPRSPGLLADAEPPVPGAYGDPHEGPPRTRHREEPRDPSQFVLPQNQGTGNALLAHPADQPPPSYATRTRSHAANTPVPRKSEAYDPPALPRGAPAFPPGLPSLSPGLPAPAAEPANALKSYHADLMRAHQQITQLERDKRELQAQRAPAPPTAPVASDSATERELAACRAELAKAQRAQQAAVDALVRERDAAAAVRLAVGAFDATLDRVSEGALRARVEALNGAVDDFVMDMLEAAKAVPLDAALAEKRPFDEATSPLLHAIQALPPGDDMRELLLDAFLHMLIVRRLFSLFFSGKVAVKTDWAEIVNNLYARVVVTEDWKVSQRWRAVTAGAISSFMVEGGKPFQDDATRTADDIADLLARGLCRQPVQLQSLHQTLVTRLGTIYDDAFQLADTSRRDVVSVHAMLVIAPSVSDLNPAHVEVQWAEMGGRSTDAVCGTYAFGLRTKAANGKRTILLRPKVVTEGLVRYVQSQQSAKK